MVLKIAVVGAGIIGLTSAYRILENIPNVQIVVIAEKFSPDTTSDVSAGYWEPYCLDESSDQARQILKWGKETYDHMLNVALSENGSKCGVQNLSAYVIQDSQTTKVPFWSKIVSQFREINKEEISSVIDNSKLNLKSGFHFITTTVVVSKYLPILTEELKSKGVKFVQKKLSTIQQFIAETNNGFDYIVNCSGLGARFFVQDENVFAVRGQVLRVKAPWVKCCIMFETDKEVTYILPLSDLVVLGGSQEHENYSLDPKEDDLKGIVQRCSRFIPSLKSAEIAQKCAGLRPVRKGGVRLEIETIKTSLGSTKCIHNYGHGGSGVTLSWGCATDTAQLIANDIKMVKSKI